MWDRPGPCWRADAPTKARGRDAGSGRDGLPGFRVRATRLRVGKAASVRNPRTGLGLGLLNCGAGWDVHQ